MHEHPWCATLPSPKNYDVDSRQAAMTPPGSEGQGAGTGPSAARSAQKLRVVGGAEQPPPNNLPLELSSFVGRGKELAEVKRLLMDNRLLTLTGSGGCGKTRLALAAAAELGEGVGGGGGVGGMGSVG